MRIIDADALKERAIRVSTVKLPHTFFKAVGTHEIDKAPTIEAKPVVHGEWIETTEFLMDVEYKCSVCNEVFCTIDGTPFDNRYNYCPNCGAKMNGEKEV